MYKIPARTLFMGQKLIYVPECHSTNSLLIELNDRSALPEGTVLITNCQTAGRGQRGNLWEASPGMNLTFSILLRPAFLETNDQFQLNMALSLAVADALQSSMGQPIKLKWPNDIYVEDKKIGGVLIESLLQGISLTSSIAGIGLNINQQQFSFPHASSLSNFSGEMHDLNIIFQKLLESLEAEYLNLRARRVSVLKQRYLTSLYKFRELHEFETNGERIMGTICDVDDGGRLYIESSGETRGFSLKEVRFQ